MGPLFSIIKSQVPPDLRSPYVAANNVQNARRSVAKQTSEIIYVWNSLQRVTVFTVRYARRCVQRCTSERTTKTSNSHKSSQIMCRLHGGVSQSAPPKLFMALQNATSEHVYKHTRQHAPIQTCNQTVAVILSTTMDTNACSELF